MIYLIYACGILPLALLAFEWSRSRSHAIELSLLTFSAILFVAADVRGGKLPFLGADYSSIRGIAILTNIVVAFVVGSYAGSKGRWIALVAGAILAVGWLLALAINSAV